MGPVADLLARARKAGLRLEAHGDRLRVTGPKSAESIVRKIQAHKAEVLAMIRAGDETTTIRTRCDGPSGLRACRPRCHATWMRPGNGSTGCYATRHHDLRACRAGRTS